MNSIIKEMLKIYPIKPLDFMGYKVTKENPYTYHHIIKRCDGGTKTIENGAILTLNAHEYLNIIELTDIKTYMVLNQMFQIINQQKQKPTLEQYQAINIILKLYEEKHINDRNSKGKILIKSKHLKREIL